MTSDATGETLPRFRRAYNAALRRCHSRLGTVPSIHVPNPDPEKALRQFRRHLAAVGFRRTAVRWHEDPSLFGGFVPGVERMLTAGAALFGLDTLGATSLGIDEVAIRLFTRAWDREARSFPDFSNARATAFVNLGASSFNVSHLALARAPDPYDSAWAYFVSARPEPWTHRFAFRFFAPLFRAWEAGLYIFIQHAGVFHLLEAPVECRVENGRVHRADGPAVRWRSGGPGGSGFRLFFWKGTLIPRSYEEAVFGLLGPHRVKAILSEANVEMRRCMIDRYGVGPFLVDAGAVVVHDDDFGTLLHLELPGQRDEGIRVVKVVNSTPEPDGTFKDYFLRVPPDVQKAKDAVAWTFGLNRSPARYNPARQT